MLLVILAAAFATMIAGGIIGCKRAERYHDDGYIAMVVFGTMLLTVLVGAWIIVGTNNVMYIERWRVFRDYNAQNYAAAVEETRVILSEKTFTQAFVEGSIEKTQVGAELSKRIAEWRDSVNRYNSTIASMRAVRNNFWLGSFIMPEIPPDLRPLVIGK